MKFNFSFFSGLRLSNYLPPNEIEKVEGFEFNEYDWVGEIYQFTQILQLEKEPGVTRSVSFDFQVEKIVGIGETILQETGISLKKGMTVEEVEAIIGQKPGEVLSFIKDRDTYEYFLENRKINVSCTVHHDNGLIYVSITVKPSYKGY